VRKVQALYQFDCLRANKSTMAWGVEARVPFLDRAFLDVAMAIDPSEKMIDKSKGRIEKYILRKARGMRARRRGRGAASAWMRTRARTSGGLRGGVPEEDQG
jgi:asparagine synthetase B (glutamine-hydrolysing)